MTETIEESRDLSSPYHARYGHYHDAEARRGITQLSEHGWRPRAPAMGSDMVIHHDTFRNA